MNKEDIKKIIPHREPFLLIDQVEQLQPGEYAVGYKCVEQDEWYLQGHFPGQPIMPGVLMVESAAQLGAVAILSLEQFKGKLVLFGGIEKAKFRRMCVPGDKLKIEVKISGLRGHIGKGEAKVTVDGQRCCECTLTFFVK